MHNVLLTGAAGFIGSHLAETLVSQGSRLRAFVHYNSRGDAGLLRQLPPSLLAEIELVTGDLTDPDTVRKAVFGCDTVFHLGALISIPYSYHHPPRWWTPMSWAPSTCCWPAAIWRRAAWSTPPPAKCTAPPVASPSTKSHPLQGQSPYSASKIGADKLVESFYRAYGLPSSRCAPSTPTARASRPAPSSPPSSPRRSGG